MESDTLYDDTMAADVAEPPRREPRGPARRVFLAGLGAIAEACDEANQRFERYVDRGQTVREQWQDRADDVRRQNARAGGKMREYFRGAMDVFLDTFNVPSRTDVDTINVKLNILTRKIDDLQMQGMDTPAAQAEPAPPPPVGDEPPVTGDLAT